MSNNELSTLTPKEKKAIRAKRWKAKNRDKVLAEKARFRENHREQLREKQSEYRKSVDGKIGKAVAKRGTGLTKKFGEELLIGQRGRCNVCGCDISHKLNNINLDHYIPISKGGLNESSNIQWLCVTCNKHKFTTSPTQPLTFILWEII